MTSVTRHEIPLSGEGGQEMTPLYRFHSESAEDGNNKWRLEWVPVDAEVPAIVRRVSITTRARLEALGMLDPTRFASEDQIDSLISEAGG